MGDAVNAFAYSAPFQEEYSIDLDNPVPSFPVSKNHNELSGYYKFTSVGGDNAVIQVNMFKNGVAIGSGKKVFTGSQSSYTAFSIPITYTSTTIIPDSSIIQIYASDPDGTNTLGTALWVDDIQLIGETNSLTEIDNHKLNIYPNPSNGLINLQIANETISQLAVYNVYGALVYSLNNLETNKLLQINENFAAGNYLVKVTTDKGVYSKIISITK